ncbi:MAG: acyl-ACP thioesterase [Phycisphaerae bacterium]|nr:acyl-ACP thioesterase [Phycisphaerae bacterium]
MKVREEKFTVKSYECRPDGNIKTACLMQYLQEAAALHAEQLGFGVDSLNTINSYWVLSNLRIEINRLPKWNDEITVKTWPSGYNRLIATREFVAKDQNNCELFRAGSQWMVLDKRSNRPKNLFHLDLSLPKTGAKVLSEKLIRLEPQDDYSQADRISVPYSSIDLNGHVNNTEYVRWGIDALRKAFKFEGNIRSMHATYLSEVFEDDKLDLLLSQNNNGHFCVLARRADEDSNVHVMEIGC